MQNLYHDLEAALQKDQAFISDGKILKNVVIEKALQLDPALLELLMGAEGLRKHFFQEVAGTLVFDKVKFQQFVSNKAFLPDSFTAFKNKIGLVSGDAYLKEANDVVLAWPYKDCVLEGGQDREDRARQEIFWNKTLAPDHLTRLSEPKVMTRFERWDSEAVKIRKAKAVKELSADDNLLIKGNNLLALWSLLPKYARKVKLIYIDPPYNTENDDFLYNDRFTHSSWLTFMKNRLEVARELLALNGSIWVSVDDKEGHYLKVLMDEVFGRENFKCTFVWQKVDSPNDNKPSIAPDHEFVLCYERFAGKAGFSQKGDTSILSSYVSTEEEPRLHRDRLLRKNGKSSNRSDRESMWFPLENPDGIETWPLHDDGREGRWSHGKRGVKRLQDEDRLIWKKVETSPGQWSWVPYAREFAKADPAKPHPTILLDVKTSRQAQAHAQEIFGQEPYLETIKPEQLLQRIVEISTRPGDLVMDFFVGSGTTAAVCTKMGRKWIAVEQMHYVQTMTLTRLKKVVEGEQGGVSEDNNWSGGGQFVYMELAELNERIAYAIDAATAGDALAELAAKLRMTGYVRPGIKLDELTSEEFAALSLDEQKQILMDCLDANHFYVNYGDIDDADYGISEEDKALNRSFYEGGDK